MAAEVYEARICYWRTAYEQSQARHVIAGACTTDEHGAAVAAHEGAEREHEAAAATLAALGVEP